VCGLGHHLENEGIATVGISLVREHTERIVPPRALWVPFEFGRPFGTPHEPDFQRRVIVAALELLEAESGPVLADFPDDAPGATGPMDGEGWTCPVDFRPPPANADDDARATALLTEIDELQPWFNLGKERRRTTFGASGLDPAACGRFLIDFLSDQATTDSWPEMRPGDVLKLVLMDMKAYYLEASTARPGYSTTKELDDWFWGDTAGGRVFMDLQRHCTASDDEFIALLGKVFIVPRNQFHRIG
jgi:hypothetical protein